MRKDVVHMERQIDLLWICMLIGYGAFVGWALVFGVALGMNKIAICGAFALVPWVAQAVRCHTAINRVNAETRRRSP